ncbi:MAG: hydroxyacylglutathione hydrolase [Methylococcaceae bacterium]
MLQIEQLPVLTDNYIYLLHDDVTDQTAVVDPALSEPVLQALKKHGWHLDYILNTHHHGDHVGGNLQLKKATGCKIIGSVYDQYRIPEIDQTVTEGDEIQLGSQTAKVLFTPGHTLGHINYYFADNAALFCGDTLFKMGCGRLFEGSAEQMWQSMLQLKALPEKTRVYCAHEYSQNNGQFALTLEDDNPVLQQTMIEVRQCRLQNLPTVPTTIGLEQATNPFFRPDSPTIQQKLQLENHPLVDVFAEIRRRKDHF